MYRNVMRGRIHHIDLTVKDAHASRPFYENLLGFMGYKLSASSDAGYEFDLVRGGFCSVGIRSARDPNALHAHDRYSPGLHHLAWSAESRADVDALHAYLQQSGATILDPPAAYPQYSDGYYAVFFADPDGLKLEYVFKP
jgi:catechol 2,3-dioxygenase-like lactoylglutathione lyase family enzyme